MILCFLFFFFFNDTATTEIYTLSLHDALPISMVIRRASLGEKNAGGEALMAASRPLAATRLRNAGLFLVSPLRRSSSVSSGGTISRRKVGIPAFARWAAIPLPITPAPSTATRLISDGIGPPIPPSPLSSPPSGERRFLMPLAPIGGEGVGEGACSPKITGLIPGCKGE